MFFSISKQRIQVVSLLVCGVIALIICGDLREREELIPTAGIPIANRVVVIDAGHGGFDAGASANGIEEKEVNLAVAQKLREYIESGGGVAVMTRVEDVSTAEVGSNGKSAKKSDLTARKQLSETADADVFVSIHMNKFPQAQYKGAQVFYGANPSDGKRLGETIQASLREILDENNQRVAKKTDGSIFILKDTLVPSVIVECGFLSNPQEAELLTQEEYRQKVAWGIYMGLVRYFNE